MDTLAVISLTNVIFGIAALLLVSRARMRFSPGSIRNFIDYFTICLSFIVIFSVWQTVKFITNIELILPGLNNFPEIVFIIIAYIGFMVASYKVLRVSEEFGFKNQGKEISMLVKEKKSNAKNRKRKTRKR